jgi:hypothetical protein
LSSTRRHHVLNSSSQIHAPAERGTMELHGQGHHADPTTSPVPPEQKMALRRQRQHRSRRRRRGGHCGVASGVAQWPMAALCSSLPGGTTPMGMTTSRMRLRSGDGTTTIVE